MVKKIFSIFSYLLHLPKKVKIPLILGLLVLEYFLFFSSNKQTTNFQYTKVEKKDLKQEVSSSGTLTGKASATLKFKSSGKLAYLNVKPGDKVTKGQNIAGLDTQDLNISLQQAQNTYRDKQATVDKIYDDLKNHSTDETYAQRQTRTSAETARDNAYDNVKAAQRAFQDAVIVSPIEGVVVGQADLTPGQNVSGSDLIAQVVDFSEIVFSADVDETDIGKIALGQKSEVSLNSYQDKLFAGSVTQIQPQTKTSSSGSTTVNVKIHLDDQSILPIYGLNGQVNIIQSQALNVLTVPISSVVTSSNSNNKFVFVKNGNSTSRKEVTTGFKNDSDIEITSGLDGNEQVVINPPSNAVFTRAGQGNSIQRAVFSVFRPQRR